MNEGFFNLYMLNLLRAWAAGFRKLDMQTMGIFGYQNHDIHAVGGVIPVFRGEEALGAAMMVLGRSGV